MSSMVNANRCDAVGSERDEYIAKLKGFGQVEHDGAWINRDVPGIAGYYLFLPQWSTNREAAWLLWDDLQKAFGATLSRQLQYAVRNGHHYVSCHNIVFAGDVTDDMQQWCVEGTDFADAVSKAWITWRMQSNERQ